MNSLRQAKKEKGERTESGTLGKRSVATVYWRKKGGPEGERELRHKAKKNLTLSSRVGQNC